MSNTRAVVEMNGTALMLQAARQLILLGYSAIPLHGISENGQCSCGRGPECSSAGKHPRGRNWLTEPATEARFAELVARGEPFNIGIRLEARAREQVIVIDVDTKHGKAGLGSLKQLEKECGPLPEHSLLQTTPSGGRHYLLRVPDSFDIGRLPNGSDVMPGIDILVEHRQFVVSPSRTPVGAYLLSGREAFPPPAELPELPERWLRALEGLARSSTDSTVVADPAPSPTSVVEILDVLPAPTSTTRDECVAFAYAVHGAIKGAELEAYGRVQDAFLRWAGRWEGANPAKDKEIWESTTNSDHRGWTQFLRDSELFIRRAREGEPYSVGLVDGADLDQADDLVGRARDEEAARVFGDGLETIRSVSTKDTRASLYRAELDSLVQQARSQFKDAVDRHIFYDVVSGDLTKPHHVTQRSVVDTLKKLDDDASSAGMFAPEVEYPGLDDRNRLGAARARYLVTDYLFADRAIHILYGEPQSKKTFVALSWALSIASDQPWTGRFPVQQGGVLLFAGEALTGLRVRKAAALAKMGITPEQAGALPFGIIPELPPLGSSRGVDAVLRLIDNQYHARHPNTPLRLVIIDTLTRLGQRAGLSTTDPKEYGILLDRVERIAHETDASILLIAHSPENNPGKPTGTYQTRANAESVIRLERTGPLESRLVVQKSKDDIEGRTLGVRFEVQDVLPWLKASYERDGATLPGPIAEALAATDFAEIFPSISIEQLVTGTGPAMQHDVSSLKRQFTSLVVAGVEPIGIGAPSRASQDDLTDESVLEVIRKTPGITKREVRASLPGRSTKVDAALMRLVSAGVIEDGGTKQRSAYQVREVARTAASIEAFI